MEPLANLAKVLRSKNSGPFELTLDILFDDVQTYRRVLCAKVLTKERIARLYRIHPEDISVIAPFDKALGIKITFQRQVSSGTLGDRDVYGAQQHAPLMNLMIP
jgi:hypothetical protein